MAAIGTAYTVNRKPPKSANIPMPTKGNAKINALWRITRTIYPIRESMTPICDPEIRLANTEKGI